MTGHICFTLAGTMLKSTHPSTYGKIAPLYDSFLTISGFKRGVENFLGRLNLSFRPGARLLDAGCGTGLVARWLASSFPTAEVIAFDIDPRMLHAAELKLTKRHLRHRLTLAVGDITSPDRLEVFPSGKSLLLHHGSVDGIFVSGALEHVPLQESVMRLSGLLKPGGLFFNLGVRRNPAGAVLAMVYRFRPYTISEMRRSCDLAGLAEIRTLRLSAEDFPANLSRVAIMAKKRI
mgnify:FL=1